MFCKDIQTKYDNCLLEQSDTFVLHIRKEQNPLNKITQKIKRGDIDN